MLYTGQDVARFCEVDLKTVHHWADRGKIPHYRTEGRHLRFRRNDLVRFLRGHGYPIPDDLADAKPLVALALPIPDEAAKKLASRFVVHRHDNAIAAIARLVSDAPDALVFAWDDPCFTGAAAAIALKADDATRFVALVAIAEEHAHSAAQDAGAELVLASRDLPRLGAELARLLAVG
jgi:excisionase family DNA binding protein